MARELGLSKDDAERKPRAKPKPKAKAANGRKRASAASAASLDDDEEGDWGDEPYEAPKAKRRRRAKAAAAAPEAPCEQPATGASILPARASRDQQQLCWPCLAYKRQPCLHKTARLTLLKTELMPHNSTNPDFDLDGQQRAKCHQGR